MGALAAVLSEVCEACEEAAIGDHCVAPCGAVLRNRHFPSTEFVHLMLGACTRVQMAVICKSAQIRVAWASMHIPASQGDQYLVEFGSCMWTARPIARLTRNKMTEKHDGLKIGAIVRRARLGTAVNCLILGGTS